jgi:transposase
MWKNYLAVIAKKAANAVHILDRFHLVARSHKAIDEIRAKEVKELEAKGYEPVLKRARWCLLKRPENLTENQEAKLADLLRYNLKSVRGYLLKEDLDGLWRYVSPAWAGKFLDRWCDRVVRSRLEPLKKVARSFRNHRPLILNWFRARGRVSIGAVEGLNNKAKVTFRSSYGFRELRTAQIALYHSLGDLPEPQGTHRFC